MKRGQPRLFLDASVLVAATLSPTGGSAVIFALAEAKVVSLIMTEEIVREARRSLKNKYGTAGLVRFYPLLAPLTKVIRPMPAPRELARFTDLIIDRDDRHVLAGARMYQADILLTLDRKHFLTQTLKNANLPFQIQTPGDFLEQLRQDLEG